ncbi:MAG: hypothetical protein ACC628_25890, partial [Pirellulaceae bacterium]
MMLLARCRNAMAKEPFLFSADSTASSASYGNTGNEAAREGVRHIFDRLDVTLQHTGISREVQDPLVVSDPLANAGGCDRLLGKSLFVDKAWGKPLKKMHSSITGWRRGNRTSGVNKDIPEDSRIRDQDVLNSISVQVHHMRVAGVRNASEDSERLLGSRGRPKGEDPVTHVADQQL